MAKIVRKSLETTIENQIVTAVIVSTAFISKIEPVINLDFFINPYAKTICKWCLQYFEKYGKAPGMSIKPIFDVEKHNLDKAEAEIIGTLLSKLSEDYVEGQGVNEEYIYDNALKLFEERDLTLRLEQATRLKDVGKINEAKDLMIQPSKVELAVTNWFQLSDPEVMRSVFDMEKRELISFPGILGKAIGPLEREWLVGLLGNFKRGKSVYMMEFVMRALLKHLKAAVISLEMSKVSTSERYYKRVSGLGDEDAYLYPVFDCQKNQLGSCERPRENSVRIRNNKRDKISRDIFVSNYIPCTLCRGKNTDYEPEVWYERLEVPKFTLKEVKKKWRGFEMMYGDNLQIKCYPRFSASVDDIRRDLDFLERSQDFIPDLIIVDYADILKPDKGTRKEDHKAIDSIWKSLAGLVAERRCLGVTGSQGNRPSLKKEQHEEEDLAEWIGKLGHVDVFLALNQTPDEKRKGVIRFNMLAHRHKKFVSDEDVIVLQHLDTMQMILDSEYTK